MKFTVLTPFFSINSACGLSEIGEAPRELKLKIPFDLFSIINHQKFDYNRIANISKVASYMYPEKYCIYDSRVAYTLNWIILSQNTGNMFFPIPEGRNSKMIAFDMRGLIRLYNMDMD